MDIMVIAPILQGLWVPLIAQLVKESACNAADPGSIPGLGRSPGEGSGNPLQYSCTEKAMDRGAWQATVHGVARVRHDLETKPPLPELLKSEEVFSFHFSNGF